MGQAGSKWILEVDEAILCTGVEFSYAHSVDETLVVKKPLKQAMYSSERAGATPWWLFALFDDVAWWRIEKDVLIADARIRTLRSWGGDGQYPEVVGGLATQIMPPERSGWLDNSGTAMVNLVSGNERHWVNLWRVDV